MPDIGLTHVALTVRDSNASRSFYERYAGLHVVHQREAHHGTGDVLWMGDGVRPFVIVLLPVDEEVERLAGPLNHLGVACASRAEVDLLVARARGEDLATEGPYDSPPPVGYWGIIEDPDGHALELSHGQEVGRTATP